VGMPRIPTSDGHRIRRCDCTRAGPSMAPARLGRAVGMPRIPTSDGHRIRRCGFTARLGILPTLPWRPPTAGAHPALRAWRWMGTLCWGNRDALLGRWECQGNRDGLSMPRRRPCWQAEPWMAERSQHGVSGGQDGRSERPTMGHGQPRPKPRRMRTPADRP
jgi:hypothetical protein